MLFSEKYRPKFLDGVVGQDHVTEYIKSYIKNDDIPHMLFSGQAGTGKTTVAKALARDLYGDNWETYYLEVNASDHTDVDHIRKKIKDYARIKVVDREYKIVFFDEAEYLSKPSQAALRRIMEMYSDKCRFIFSCNYPEKIIDPLIDRCVVFRFCAIKQDDMMPMLKDIVKKESIDITPEALKELTRLSYGSMRRPLNVLHLLKSGNKTNITKQDVHDILGVISQDEIIHLLSLCKRGNIKEVEKNIDDMLDKKFSPKEILRTMRYVLIHSTLSKEKKLSALEFLGDATFKISLGGDSDIQIKTFLIRLISLFGE